ncbi:MAG: amidohydrolase family protein [Planctomycetaceae bacterium]
MLNHWQQAFLVGWTVFSLALTAQTVPADERYDLVLQGGTLHRGDGSEPFEANLGIRGGKIAVISPDKLSGNKLLDCSGLVIAPGFIDLHNHSDDSILKNATRGNVNYLLQGCTTVVTGNCGFGPTDVRDYLTQVDKQGAGTHIAHLLPQGSLRDAVLGKANRSPTAEELERMRKICDRAMTDGAFGMSTGLIYVPGTFTETAELIEIAKVVAAHDGFYASHIRGEGQTLLTAIDEALRIGREAGTPVHISHFKASGRPNWGTLRLAIEQVEQARASGQQVTADQCPYIASSTSLEATLLPKWAREGGRSELKKRLTAPETLARIRADVQTSLHAASRIQLASCRFEPTWIGKSLDDIAELTGRDVLDVVMDIETRGGAQVVSFGMSEDDVRLAMPLLWVATASDGGAKIPTRDQPHPRSFGTFPRKIGHYAIEEQVLSLPAAIRSASGLPADILGLTDRGWLREGLAADIVVFDPKTFRDQATFTRPDLPASGVRHVLVEGTLAIYEGVPTGTLTGHALRKVSTPLAPAAPESTTEAQPSADWAVRQLIQQVQTQQGRGETFSIDFNAYSNDLRDLPIGVFDSGIGGLTVLQALLTSDLHDNQTGRPGPDGVADLARERFLYLGDQANMPYGNYAAVGKEDLLREFILRDALFLLGQRVWPDRDGAQPVLTKPPVKAIVIACNTATAYGLEDIRLALQTWGLPVLVVGVVEAGANSVVDLLPRDSDGHAIAVLATTGTCSSGAYPRAIAQSAGQRGRRQPLVIQQGSVSLAGVIERDPAFTRESPRTAAEDYRGPAIDSPNAAINPEQLARYNFDPAGLFGDERHPESWQLNSVENYVRYDVTSLVEEYRRSGATRPIGYVMLGCTHFPLEAERIRAAFERLRNHSDADGTQPYRSLIAEDLQLVDPATLTAKELFRELFLSRRLVRDLPKSTLSPAAQPAVAEQLDWPGFWNQHRLFVSVPAPAVTPDKIQADGWFRHDYKYGRSAGNNIGSDTRIVPLHAGRMPNAIRDLIQSRCPQVAEVLAASSQHVPPTD